MQPAKLSYFYIYQSENHTWSWRLMSRQGHVLAVNPESYPDLPACKEDIRQMVKDSALAVCIGDSHYMSVNVP